MQLRKIAKNRAVLPPVNVKNREKSALRAVSTAGGGKCSGPVQAAGASVVTGYHNAFVEFNFHVQASRSMGHPTGFQGWLKSIALMISSNPYYPYQTFDIGVDRGEGRGGETVDALMAGGLNFPGGVWSEILTLVSKTFRLVLAACLSRLDAENVNQSGSEVFLSMQIRNSTSQFGIVSIVAHWLVALAVFGLFGLGYYMVGLSYYDEWYRLGPDIHRSIGILLFIAVVLRVVWRLKKR